MLNTDARHLFKPKKKDFYLYFLIYFSDCYRVIELFTWLIEVTEDAAELYDGARVVWSARFEPHQEEPQADAEAHRAETRKPMTKLDIQKDDIQAVVPISKVRVFHIFLCTFVPRNDSSMSLIVRRKK